MSSLRQILEAHTNVLLIDACSSRIQVGCIQRGMSDRWESSDAEAAVGVFVALQKLAIRPSQMGAFIFCDGPGSVLGIRTSAMALRTWNVISFLPTFAYCGLALVAHAMNRPEVTVIADARREQWHQFRPGAGLTRGPATNLTGPLAIPEGFRYWSALPGNVIRVAYDLPALLEHAQDADLFHPTAAPDAFLHEEPSYLRWTPQIHRAPSAS